MMTPAAHSLRQPPRTIVERVGEPGMHRSDLADVRFSRAAADALEGLPRSQQRAVAQAVQHIDRGETGQRLKIEPPDEPDGAYFAMETADSEAPVVIYRRITDQDDVSYVLVTALVDRADFGAYQRADDRGLLDTSLGKFLLGDGAGASLAAILRGKSRR